jgi:stage V sporulation protein B
MALPVVLYPGAILTAFAALLIPEITEQAAAKNRREIRYVAGRAYQLTLLFSVGVSGILLFFSNELGIMLYDSSDAGRFIRLLAPLVPIMYLDTATDAMLKGLGQQVYSMNVNIMDALISVASVALLVPRMGIMGYLVTIYVTEIFNAALSVWRLLRVSGLRPQLFLMLARPYLCVVGATAITRLLTHLLHSPIACSGQALTVRITLTILCYLCLLGGTGAWKKEDSLWLLSFLRPPKAPKLLTNCNK